VWATAIGLIAYFLGQSAGGAIEAFGLFGLAAVLLAITAAVLFHCHQRRQAAQRANAAATERARLAGLQEPRDAGDVQAG
jgi:hypothetical protein